jgi:hypothetical protein
MDWDGMVAVRIEHRSILGLETDSGVEFLAVLVGKTNVSGDLRVGGSEGGLFEGGAKGAHNIVYKLAGDSVAPVFGKYGESEDLDSRYWSLWRIGGREIGPNVNDG